MSCRSGDPRPKTPKTFGTVGVDSVVRPKTRGTFGVTCMSGGSGGTSQKIGSTGISGEVGGKSPTKLD